MKKDDENINRISNIFQKVKIYYIREDLNKPKESLRFLHLINKYKNNNYNKKLVINIKNLLIILKKFLLKWIIINVIVS